MGWLQDVGSKIKKGAKRAVSSPGSFAKTALGGTATEDTYKSIASGAKNVGQKIEDKFVGKKTDTGKKLGASAQQEAGELAGIRQGMETDYTGYQGQRAAERGRYRGEEDTADTAYDTKVDENAAQAGAIETGLAEKAEGLSTQAKDQANDASKVYTENVRPKMQANMEDAMSLRDYMNPNNSVQSAYRGMYNQLGQGARNQGLADFGILASLGGQAAARGMAGRAMSGAQMQGAQQAGLGQAGLAYQKAQQRMQQLQDQGIMTGIAQSDKAYDAGQQARQDFTNEEARQLDLGSRGRSEQQGFSREGADLRMSGVNRQADINAGRYGRDTSKRGARYGENLGDIGSDYGFRRGMTDLAREDIGRKYGTTREGILGSMQEEQARAGAIRAMTTAGLGAGAQVAGSYLGSRGNKPAAQAQQEPNAQTTTGEPDDATPSRRRSYYA